MHHFFGSSPSIEFKNDEFLPVSKDFFLYFKIVFLQLTP